MATWSTKTSSDSSDIFARTFNSTRSISAPFAVSSVNTKNEYPHICMTSHDSGVFTWYDAKTQDIMMRRYKSGAMTKYDESRINQPSNTQRNGYKGTSFPPILLAHRRETTHSSLGSTTTITTIYRMPTDTDSPYRCFYLILLFFTSVFFALRAFSLSTALFSIV